MKYFFMLLPFLVTFEVCSQQVDPLSKSSCFVITRRGSKNLRTATGFFYKSENDIFFLTNNHVVGGKYARDEFAQKYHKPMPLDSIPDNLLIRIYTNRDFNNQSISLKVSEQGNGAYIKIHNGPDTIDVVAIKLTDATAIRVQNCFIFDEGNVDQNILMRPSSEVFIVGFPLYTGQLLNYPIWKRATIASTSKPNDPIIVDATTRGGMSGSPVIFRNRFYFNSYGGAILTNTDKITITGVYSAQYYDMELGVVWPIKLVIDQLKVLKLKTPGN